MSSPIRNMTSPCLILLAVLWSRTRLVNCVCQRVVVEGSTLQTHSMGVYHIQATTANKRPVYGHECGLLSLHHVTIGGASYWVISPDVGNTAVTVRSLDNSSDPSRAVSPWEEWSASRRKWVNNGEAVSVECVDDICQAITFVGSSLPNELLIGPYELDSYYYSNRPVYKHYREEIYIYYYATSVTERWIVGPKIGSKYASLYSYEEKYSPQNVERWTVITPEQKIENSDSQVRCVNHTVAECGVRKVFPPETFIVNSDIAYNGKWPWSVSLLKENGIHRCGGVLLSDRWVLTSAHCITSENETVLVGAFNLDLPEPTSKHHTVRNFHTHPTFFTQEIPFRMIDDIALLELEDTVEFNDYVQPACLPDENEGLPYLNQSGGSNFQNCHIIGWGMTNFQDDVGGPLQELSVERLIDIATCKEEHYSPIFVDIDWMSDTLAFCTLPKRSGKTCLGDSGSPMMCEKDGKWTILGISSWAVTLCLPATIPSVYTDITKYIAWMNSVMD